MEKRWWIAIILAAILLIIATVFFKVTNSDNSIWGLLVFAVVYLIIFWVISRPMKKEIEQVKSIKGARPQDKNQILSSYFIKNIAITLYFASVIFFILGAVFLIILFLPLFISSSNVSASSWILLMGAISLVLIGLGILLLFAAKGLEKGKKWGRTLTSIFLIILAIGFLPLLFWGIIKGQISSIIFGVLMITGAVYLLYFLFSKVMKGSFS